MAQNALRGYKALELKRALAIGSPKVPELAKKYEVTPQAIYAFKARYADDIAEIAADLENEFAGQWVAKKQNRIEEYQRDIEDIAAETAANGKVDVNLLKVKHGALKSVAEELGQLPARVHVTVQGGVRHEIVGIDPEAVI